MREYSSLFLLLTNDQTTTMKRIKLIALLFASSMGFTQTTIWQESFEVDGEGSAWVSTSPFYDGSDDYFTRVVSGSPSIGVECPYTGADGVAYWAVEDTDDNGGDALDYKAITFQSVSTTGYSSLEFRGLFAVGRCPADLYDNPDGAVVSYSTDGGGSWTQGVKFRFDDVSSDGFNEDFGSITTIDPTCLISTTNGGFGSCSATETPGGGGNIDTYLTNAFTELSFSIPGTPSSVIIRIEMAFDAGGEEFAIDNFRILGSSPCTDPDIPSLSASPSTICPGETSTITITGALNDATDWQVYSGSCGGASEGSTTSSTFDVSPSTTTTYYIRGEGGCVTPGSCGSVTITADDVTDPDITTCPGDQDLSVDGSCEVTLPDFTGDAVYSDDCDASPSISQSPTAGTLLSGAGTVQTVTLTVTDASGNSTDCSFEVTLVDDTDPVIVDCPTDQSLAPDSPGCTATVVWTEPTVTDNCTGATIGGSHSSGSSFSQGITTVTYTATDGSGNTATCMFNIEVISDLTTSATTVTETSGGDGEIDLTVTGGSSPYTYDWDNDGTGDADDDEDLTGLTGGDYTVIVVDANGCTDTLTVTVDSHVGVDAPEGVGLKLYPNPTTGLVTIEVSGSELIAVEVVNAIGQQSRFEKPESNKMTIELEDFATGIYMVKIETKAGIVHRRLIIE